MPNLPVINLPKLMPISIRLKAAKNSANIIKQMEDDILKQYEEELKNLTVTQGTNSDQTD